MVSLVRRTKFFSGLIRVLRSSSDARRVLLGWTLAAIGLLSGCAGVLGPTSAATAPLSGDYDGPISPADDGNVKPIVGVDSRGRSVGDGNWVIIFKYVSFVGSNALGFAKPSHGPLAFSLHSYGALDVRIPIPVVGVLSVAPTFGFVNEIGTSSLQQDFGAVGWGGRLSLAPVGPGAFSLDLGYNRIHGTYEHVNSEEGPKRTDDATGSMFRVGASALFWGTHQFRFGLSASYDLIFTNVYNSQGATFAFLATFY